MSLCAGIIVTGVFCSPVEARVVMETLHTGLKSADKMTEKTYVDKDRMRMDMKGKEMDMTLIFRKDKEVYWEIDNNEMTYRKWTKEDFQRIKAQIEQIEQEIESLKAEMEESEDLSPEIMEEMEEMTVKSPEINYKKKRSGVKVNQWVCDYYEGISDGEKVEKVWTTDWEELGFTPEDIKVIGVFDKFYEGAFKETHPFFKFSSQEWEKEIGYSGFPVRSVHYSEGTMDSKTELKEVKRQDLDPSLFELPEGVKRIKE
jgi:hypothetical protein